MSLDILRDNGYDVDGALRRFINNEGLYIKCLKKLLTDASYDDLKSSFEDGNINAEFKAAHTLKGVVSNLGVTPLVNVIVPLVEKLRVGNNITKEEMNAITKAYNDACEIIETL